MSDHRADQQDCVTSRGVPLPMGATVTLEGVNFSIFSKHATYVTLVLFRSREHVPFAEIPLSPEINKTGDIWHICVCGLSYEDVRYGYKMDKIPNPDPKLYRFDPDTLLLDPYAKGLSGASQWGVVHMHGGNDRTKVRSMRSRRSIIHKSGFKWGDDTPPNIPMEETIIYELHVRGYTRHPSSGVVQKGTFMGLCEKIPYLKDLGITAVEMLPVYEFEETDTRFYDPVTKKPLLNFWGYHPISFFAPKASYATNGRNGAQIEEFKQMVSTFHDAGIEVILDVVFNHTAEGDDKGHTFNFRGIDNAIYYMIDRQDDSYLNYSGCGNTVNCNNPVVREMIIDALRYWVTEMHVDGFRFDLASILGRGQDGEVLASPPLLERIAHDPILANTKLIAEAWDAAGLYQVGTFPAWGRWAEWNGRFRDDIRSYVKGDAGGVPALAQRIMGSPDVYLKSGRTPFHSINFVTSHDGFTLRDLVSYSEKHNWYNGEKGRDGDNHNLSWNCGVEGESDDPAVEALRRRQQKNFFFLLLISEGVPMILGGDEFGRTQLGNNNAYCQDNEISWVDWSLLERNRELHRFVKKMICFRKRHRLLKFQEYIFASEDKAKAEIHFHGTQEHDPDWRYASRSLGIQVRARAKRPMALTEEGREVYLFIFTNAFWEALEVELPQLEPGLKWYRNIDTSLDSPDDIVDSHILLDNQKTYTVAARSNIILTGA